MSGKLPTRKIASGQGQGLAGGQFSSRAIFLEPKKLPINQKKEKKPDKALKLKTHEKKLISITKPAVRLKIRCIYFPV